jgi:hypothetical protein
MIQASTPYRAGIAVAVLASFLIVWTTIVRDDGLGIGFFMIILAAALASFSASFSPAGMARAMAGAAGMQALLAIAIVTAPSTANLPGGATKILIFSAAYATLWLIAALCFHAAARGSAPIAAAR